MQEPTKYYQSALTIAGSDSCGGAGIQADVKTFSALGVYGMSVITALTAQNTIGVDAILYTEPYFVSMQLESILRDITPNATKIGMLGNNEIISIISRNLKEYSLKNTVIDPVMVSKSGASLLDPFAIDQLKKEIFPLATILTPNLPEASVLLDRKIETPQDMEAAAYDLLDLGSQAVLLKGGHLSGDLAQDCLVIKRSSRISKLIWFRTPKIETRNTHGTGCTLSSAIAAYLAKGYEITEAVANSKDYLTGALRRGSQYKVGNGNGPVCHHFTNLSRS